jgi:rfaE bifunctional protein nucleotidyltransferase chain/domain
LAKKLPYEEKIYSPVAGIDIADWISGLAHPLVFTNGCFDILHRGHVSYLQQAARLGASLVVGINSDESVNRLGKDPLKPINTLEDRMALVAALESVDGVISFAEDTPLDLIITVRPDVLVKGGDWPIDKIVGGAEVASWGGSVHSIEFEFERSTTSLIEKIRG